MICFDNVWISPAENLFILHSCSIVSCVSIQNSYPKTKKKQKVDPRCLQCIKQSTSTHKYLKVNRYHDATWNDLNWCLKMETVTLNHDHLLQTKQASQQKVGDTVSSQEGWGFFSLTLTFLSFKVNWVTRRFYWPSMSLLLYYKVKIKIKYIVCKSPLHSEPKNNWIELKIQHPLNCCWQSRNIGSIPLKEFTMSFICLYIYIYIRLYI